MEKMTRENLRAYRARWKRINKFHAQEVRRTPIEKKIKQSEMLFQLAQSIGLRHAIDDPEIVAVRKRWVKLKRRYEKSKRT